MNIAFSIAPAVLCFTMGRKRRGVKRLQYSLEDTEWRQLRLEKGDTDNADY